MSSLIKLSGSIPFSFLNHSHSEIILKYNGITDEEIECSIIISYYTEGNVDKTQFINTELKKMLEKGEIDESYVEEIREIIEYLTHNNIFKCERVETIEQLPEQILNILSEARKRYFSNKKDKEKLGDKLWKVQTSEPNDGKHGHLDEKEGHTCGESIFEIIREHKIYLQCQNSIKC